MEPVKLLAGFHHCNSGKLEEAGYFKCGFIAYRLYIKRSALGSDLLSYNSLFVGQLYEDKSLALHTCDLIFFTSDLQNSELIPNKSLLELIYFLTSKVPNTRIAEFANTVDPDETAHDEPSHQDLQCLPSSL